MGGISSLGLTKSSVRAAGLDTIRLAYPPSLPSLPAYVGTKYGIFEDAGFSVKLRQAGGASDAAFLAHVGGQGGADCAITDLTSAALSFANADGGAVITSGLFRPRDAERYLGLVHGSAYDIESLDDLVNNWIDEKKKNSIVLDTNSDVHYAMDFLLQQSGFDIDEEGLYLSQNDLMVATKDLIFGSFISAVLPEPLLTIATSEDLMGSSKAKVLSDFSTVSLLPSVLLFSERRLKKDSEIPRRFNEAWAAAAEATNQTSKSDLLDLSIEIITETEPEMRSIVKSTTIPKGLEEQFILPTFPEPFAVSQEDYNPLLEWLERKGLLKTAPSYEEVILEGASFLRND